MPSSNGRSTAACTARIADLPGFEAAELAGIVLADFLEDFRLAARRFDLVVEVADLGERHLRVDDLAGERHRAVAQLSLLDDGVDDAPFERLLGVERRARQNNVERILDAAQPRQTLRAAGAGNEPELDFRQAELCRRHRNAIMARQRHFEAAAERRAVNGGDNRLGVVFERILDFGNRRALRRLAELGMSAPAMKVRPAQIRTMALTAGSAAACCAPSRRPLRTSADNAFTGGELIVRTAISPSRVRSVTALIAAIARFLFNLPGCAPPNKLARKIYARGRNARRMQRGRNARRMQRGRNARRMQRGRNARRIAKRAERPSYATRAERPSGARRGRNDRVAVRP